MIFRDKFFSNIFGYDAYKIEITKNDNLLELDLPSSKAFLYTKFSTDRTDLIKYFQIKGFTVVDVSVMLEMLPLQFDYQIDENIQVCEICSQHSSSILKIAKSCFTMSRFHLDPEINNAIANLIKQEWVRNYLTGERGDRLLVALQKDKDMPLGFLAEMKMHNSDKTISFIDLIGVDKRYQGQGIGNELISWMINNKLSKTINAIRVTTQIANIQSIKFYEKCGFRIISSSYVMHAHNR